MIQRLESPSRHDDPGVLRRFDQKQTVLARAKTDADAQFCGKRFHDRSAQAIASGRAGDSRLDYTRSRAARTVSDHFLGAYSWERLGEDDPYDAAPGSTDVTDVPAITQQAIQAASISGADLVGISEPDRRRVYSFDQHGSPFHIASAFRYAIVMAMRMDPVPIRSSPAFPAATAVGVGYSRMAFAIACLAEFIRNLGYSAIPIGNDTAMTVPLAIDAGLGGLGRNGLLVIPQLGACARL